LEELAVKKAVKGWIKSKHPDWVIHGAWHFDIIAGPTKNQHAIAIECKGGYGYGRSKIQRAIGQCLNYKTIPEFRNVPCYIAIPKGFWGDTLLNTLEYHKLPIGVLIVTENKEVKIVGEYTGEGL